MAKSPTDRKRQFRAALALADMTMQDFADQTGYSRFHLSEVLAGERKSTPLGEAIDAFIEAWSLRAA